MRTILLLLIVGFCLVSAKYLPSETRDSNMLSRIKRSDDSDDSSSSSDKKFSESNANGDDEDNDDDDDDITDKQFKENDQEDKIKRKAVERQEKEKRKQEEQQKKIEEKRAKEQRKEQEKREKEERKRLEKLEKEKRKEDEKRLKEEKKKQVIEEKQLRQLEKESFDKFEEDDFLETEEETSVELADVWKNHIYVKYGLTLASTKIEKQAALKRYLQEELGLSPNSTESERRQAIVQLIQTKLQGDAAERTALKNQLISHINAVSIQKLRTKLEKDLEELNNKTQILSNVSLPWVSAARQNVEDKKSFLETITQFLSSILPNWVIGVQTVENSNSDAPVISNRPSDAIAENSININSENSISQSGNSNTAQTGINAAVPIDDKNSVGQSSVVTGSSDATPINVNDKIINSNVAALDDSTTGANVGVISTTSMGNSLPPSGEKNEASVNDINTLITGVIGESSTADSTIVSPNTEKSSTNEPPTSISDNVPLINISKDTTKNDNTGSKSGDGSISSSIVDNITSTALNTDSPIGIKSSPDGAIPNKVDTANSSQLSPGGTLSSRGPEGTLDIGINLMSPNVPEDTLTTKSDSASSNSINISSSSIGTKESPASSNVVSSGYSNVESANAADNVVVSSNVHPSGADVGTSEDSVIYTGGDEIIAGGSTIIPSESNNIVPITQNVVSFEDNQAISSNNIDSASTNITNSIQGTSLDITTSPSVISFESNKAVSSNSVDSELTSITDKVSVNNVDITISPDVVSLESIKTVSSNSADDKSASISNDLLDTSLGTTLAVGKEGVSLNVGSISVTEGSFATGTDLVSSIASDFTENKIDSISTNTAVNNTTVILVEPTTEGNEISNSNIIASATGSADNNNEIASPSGNSLPVHDAETSGDVVSVSINDVTPVTSTGSTENNVINAENRNATTLKSLGVTSADEHVISEGSTNVNEISNQPIDTSFTVKAVETTIAPETNPVKPDGETSVQLLLVSTENPVDSGLVNEVVTTLNNIISNVNTVSASVETSTLSDKLLVQTSQDSLDNTVPIAELTTLRDVITIPVEEGASVVEILQQ